MRNWFLLLEISQYRKIADKKNQSEKKNQSAKNKKKQFDWLTIATLLVMLSSWMITCYEQNGKPQLLGHY